LVHGKWCDAGDVEQDDIMPSSIQKDQRNENAENPKHYHQW
jgi:hypothetical protein